MASPISYILTQYKSKLNWFLKAYEPNTTTEKTIYFEVQELTGSNKLSISADGFIKNPNTNENSTLYISGYFDLHLFENEAEADANDFTNSIKIADNVTADKDSASLNLFEATEEIYGTVRFATQTEAEATIPVDENLAVSPLHLNKIAVDNMQDLKSTNTDITNKSDTKWMTAEDFDLLASQYTPAVPVKEYETGMTLFKHKDKGDVDNRFLRQDGATFNPVQFPDLAILPDYKNITEGITGVTQGTKTQQINTNSAEHSPIKFIKIGVKRWIGVINLDDKVYFCESINLKDWTIISGELSNHDLSKTMLAYNPIENTVNAVSSINKDILMSEALLTNTPFETITGLSGVFKEIRNNVTLISFIFFNNQFWLFWSEELSPLSYFKFNSIADDPNENVLVLNTDKEYRKTIGTNTNEIGVVNFYNNKIYFLSEFNNKLIINEFDVGKTYKSIFEYTPTLTQNTNFKNIEINENGQLAIVVGHDSATGKFEIIKSDDRENFEVVIIDTGFTSMSSDCYATPIKNYWLLKNGVDFNTAYTKDLATIDLETNYTGLGSHKNMFASFNETTNTFIEYTSAGTDGFIYTLENNAVADITYKTIKMMGAPSGGGISGFTTPTETISVQTGGQNRTIKFLKVNDTKYYGIIVETIVDATAYNFCKSTDGENWTIIPVNLTPNIEDCILAYGGDDKLAVGRINGEITYFDFITETKLVDHVKHHNNGNIVALHYNENLAKYVLMITFSGASLFYIYTTNDFVTYTTDGFAISGLNFAGSNEFASYTDQQGVNYFDGKYYFEEHNNKKIYSIEEGTWALTDLHTFTPTLTAKTFNYVSPYINKLGHFALIIGYSGTNQFEILYSTDRINFTQKLFTSTIFTASIISNCYVIPFEDYWMLKPSNTVDMCITKDFETISYETDAFTGTNSYMMSYDTVNNKIREYTLAYGDGNIYINSLETISESADPNYFDRSNRNTYPYVYAGIPQT